MSKQRDELADILMSEEVIPSDVFGRDYALAEADAILAAGYRRVNPRDAATVERVAQAIFARVGPLDSGWDDAAPEWHPIYRQTARLAIAAMEGEQ